MRKVRSGYRYYSPELGRWGSRDPIAETASVYNGARNGIRERGRFGEAMERVPAGVLLEMIRLLAVPPDVLGQDLGGKESTDLLAEVVDIQEHEHLYRGIANNPLQAIDPLGAAVKICNFLGHQWIKTDRCGSWGFFPVSPLPFTAGQVVPDGGYPFELCITLSEDKCYEEHVCTAIAISKAAPPNYNLFWFNCQTWVQSIGFTANTIYSQDSCCEGSSLVPSPGTNPPVELP